mgnify:CR=1 FL=1
MEPKKVVVLRLSLEEYAALKELGQASFRTVPAYIRQIIKYYLNHLKEWDMH